MARSRDDEPRDDQPRGHTLPTYTGTIKRIIGDKGFGFLKPDGGGEECFFHRSDCDDFAGLSEGDQVSFVRTLGAKGPRAERVAAV